MADPRFLRARAHRHGRRTSGTLTLNSTTWANVDTGLDRTLEAQVGHTLMAVLNARWGSEAVNGCLDVATIVSAAVVNTFAAAGAESATSDGIQSWFGATGTPMVVGAPAFYTVVAGDIADGKVTCRLRYRTLTAANKTLLAVADDPLAFLVINLGPPDPE